MFTKYGNSEIKNHPHGVCKTCGIPLQEHEHEIKLCSECVAREVGSDKTKGILRDQPRRDP